MIRSLVTLVFLASTLAADARAQEAAGGTADALARVSWLTGCWSMSAPGVTIEEYWMPPRGGSMVGMSRTVRGDRITGFELILIHEADGTLRYEAHPSGQEPAVFESTGSNDETIIFENPQHDFPRRIVYRRVGADSIRAVIDDGNGRGSIEFRYVRTDCGR